MAFTMCLSIYLCVWICVHCSLTNFRIKWWLETFCLYSVFVSDKRLKTLVFGQKLCEITTPFNFSSQRFFKGFLFNWSTPFLMPVQQPRRSYPFFQINFVGLQRRLLCRQIIVLCILEMSYFQNLTYTNHKRITHVVARCYTSQNGNNRRTILSEMEWLSAMHKVDISSKYTRHFHLIK